MSVRFITELHNQLRATRTIKNVHFVSGKSYPRFEQKLLPALIPITAPLSDVLRDRRSCETPMSGASISLENLSQILGHSMKIRDDGHRPHPSGGARYPLEAYVLVFNVDGIPKKTYHYQSKTHALEHLWEFDAEAVPHEFLFDQEGHCKNASVIILLTSCWERSSMRYSNFSYPVGLMEAGHVMQNILLTSTALGLYSRPYAGFNEQKINKLLDVDTENEQIVYSVALGAA